jgi:hypothetical protein
VSEQQKISDEAVEGLAYRLSESFFASPARDEAHHERRWRELLREDERERYREVARAHLAAAYPLLRQQWEAELSECDEFIELPVFFQGTPRQRARCTRKPSGHTGPHRSDDGMEWSLKTEATDV